MRKLLSFSAGAVLLALWPQASFSQTPAMLAADARPAANSVNASGVAPQLLTGRTLVQTGGSESKAPVVVADVCGDACCGKCPHIAIFADFLYLKARDQDIPFGQVFNGCTSLATPAGSVGVLSPDYSPGVRIGGTYVLNCDSCITATFLWWDVSTNGSLNAPEGSVIRSLVLHPNTETCSTDSLTANAGERIDLRVGDIAYCRHLSTSDCYMVNWCAGIRYGHIDQKFDAQFFIVGENNVNTKIDFDGIGPRVGLDGTWNMHHGLNLYGKTSLSLLAGHFGSDYVHSSIFAGTIVSASFETDRIVPVADLELGVGWTSCNGRWHASVGYYLSAWFNMLTTNDYIGAVQTSNFTTDGGVLQNCITFDGLVTRLEYRF